MSLPFQISKRAGESRLYPVAFDGDFTTFTIDFVSIEVFDSEGENVTDTMVDDYFTSFQENVAQFMVINGAAGEQYTIYVNAHMTDGEELIAKGLLTVTE